MRTILLGTAIMLIITTIVCAGDVLLVEAPTDIYIAPRNTPSTLTVGWVGDMVPSNDPLYNQSVFVHTQEILRQPDLMIGNLEGTFAKDGRVSKCVYLLNRCHAFRGDVSFAHALKDAGFDFVSWVNNHSYDYGNDGLVDTENILDEVGIPFISPTRQSTSINIKDKKIGILGLSSTQPTKTITDYAFIQNQVKKLKEENDFVIILFHGGGEGSDKTAVPGTTEYMGTENRGNVQLVAYTAIDAGADLILGAGPHVLRKIEIYKGKPIAYSLGNFVGGNGKLLTNGILGISGILTTTLEQGYPTTYDFTSTILSRNGIPTIDPLEQGKQLIDELSRN